MKACILRKDTLSLDGVQLVERPEPTPGRSEVLIRMQAASLNYRDHLIVTNRYGTARVDEDLILLSDAAGEVVALGDNVSRFKVGDRVAGTFFQVWKDGPRTHQPPALGLPLQGVLAELVALHEDGVVHIPPSLSYEEAAALPCAGVTAWNATMVSGRAVKPGDTVLCLGAGGVSMLAAQFADAAGARVIVMSSSDEKLKRAYALLPKQNAADGINYREVPEWDQKVLQLTAGRGADHVIETGGADTLARSYTALAFGGRVALIGYRPGAVGDSNPWPLMMKEGHLDGVGVGSTRMFEDMNRAIEINRIKPPVDTVFSFGEVVEAFKYFASGSFVGKVVIRIEETV
ncbi:MAG: NAD(P)-dependent alcohol dehydrogenase [Gammaproteobacteria bacterium]